MNEGPDFQPRADNEADRDPLLGALRQRLGEGFGQEPPPELWASIRRQLPAAAPRPWWLRSRRLLALLLLVGGVLLSGLAVWLAGPKQVANPLAHRPAIAPAATRASVPSASSASSPTTAPGTASSAGASSPVAAPGVLGRSQHSPVSQTTSATSPATTATASGQELAATHAPRGAATSTPPASPEAASALSAVNSTNHRIASATIRSAERTLPGGVATRHRTRRVQAVAMAASVGNQPPATSPLAGSAAGNPVSTLPTEAETTSAASQPATGQGTTGEPRVRPAAAASTASRRARRTQRLATRSSARRQPADVAAAGPLAATTQRPRRAKRRPTAPRAVADQEPSLVSSYDYGPRAALVPPTALDSLARRQASLLQSVLALPAPLDPRPDSTGPWLPRARRWSVLALVGPTISYRTTTKLFSPALSFAPTPTNTATFVGGSSTSASLVELERPAAGLGAQVQVRRVLTGRWALALGAGYHEYATRLALQVTRRAVATPTNSAFDSTFTVHQRDTYRLLTLPVQLSYALGPPRGRLSLGLLAGLEPSLYMGGRTTEGSSCNCQQQVFTSASGSPYNALSLGLSLGLDARYRLGGPASRWQWVLQPTGRYVASPFVRSSTLYVRRQPYSFGLLTGLAWEF